MLQVLAINDPYKPQHLKQDVCSVQVSSPVFAPVATASRHTEDPDIPTASCATITGQPLPAKTIPNHKKEVHVTPALHPQQQKHQMKTPQMQSLVATAADARSSLYTALQPGQQQEQESQQSKAEPQLQQNKKAQHQQLLPMPKDNTRLNAPTLKDQCDAFQHMFPKKSIQTKQFVFWAMTENAGPAPMWVTSELLNCDLSGMKPEHSPMIHWLAQAGLTDGPSIAQLHSAIARQSAQVRMRSLLKHLGYA